MKLYRHQGQLKLGAWLACQAIDPAALSSARAT